MATRLQKYLAIKQASLGGDYAAAALDFAGAIPGTLHGFFDKNTDVYADELGAAPGVGASRLVRRQRNVRKKLAPDKFFQRGRILSDLVSPGGQMLLLALAGGIVGGIVGDIEGRAELGAIAGAGAGLATGGMVNMAGALAAALTRKRTIEEQAKAENRSGIWSWLVPGKGTYDSWKRLGASTHFDKTRD